MWQKGLCRRDEEADLDAGKGPWMARGTGVMTESHTREGGEEKEGDRGRREACGREATGLRASPSRKRREGPSPGASRRNTALLTPGPGGREGGGGAGSCDKEGAAAGLSPAGTRSPAILPVTGAWRLSWASTPGGADSDWNPTPQVKPSLWAGPRRSGKAYRMRCPGLPAQEQPQQGGELRQGAGGTSSLAVGT